MNTFEKTVMTAQIVCAVVVYLGVILMVVNAMLPRKNKLFR